MKRLNIFHTSGLGKPLTKSVAGRTFILLLVASLAMLSSCQKVEKTNIVPAGDLAITTSEATIVLNQKDDRNNAVTISWTTGTNNGTGASISYVLQVDKQGNNFAKPLTFDMGKAVYEKSFKVSELNDSLLSYFGFQPGIQSKIEARVIATVHSSPITNSTSGVVTFSVTPYEPVSRTLYLIGDASPNGLDVNNAIALTPGSDDPTTFTYQGTLKAGELKFITTLGALLPSYQMGKDSSTLVYRTDEAQPDNKFVITEAGIYIIKLNLVDLTISITKLPGPPYNVLYMVGDATPNGWDIANATPMVQNPDNLFQFTYDGVLTPGDFKIPVNRNTDWQQDMYMRDPSDSTKAYLHHGGDPDDSKWAIYKENWYHVMLDLSDNTITIQPFRLFIVGSATPIGWDISNAIELTQDPNKWYIFTYQGKLVEGEFKFPVNRNTDWGQNMYMPDPNDPTKMYLHKGGDPDDNKWTIAAGNAGTYLLTLNVQALTINIQKQ